MNTVKILLIIPPETEKLVMERGQDVNEAYGTFPPIGLLYIATFLKEKMGAAVEIRVEDCSLGAWSHDAFADLLRDYRPDLLGLTAFTPLAADTKYVLERTKALLPDCRTVIGGAHVTSFQEEALCYKEADFGVMGYGEYPFWKLIEALFFNQGALVEIPGLLYRATNGEIRKNPPNDRIISLDDIPHPDYGLIPFEKYRSPVGVNDVMASMVSSRGCPFPCTFCNSPDKVYQERSMEKVIEEIHYYQSLGINEVFFFDDLFNLKNSRVYDFCDLLEKHKIKISWGFKSRVGNIDDALMQRLKETGCERLHFGLETHTDESLKALKKGIKVKQIENAVALCDKYGINSAGSFMINLPGDTRQEILDRFAFTRALKLDYLQVAILIAYNHTQIFDDGVAKGYWPKTLWSDFIRDPGAGFTPPFWNNGIPREELEALAKKGLRDFYFRVGYVWRRLRNLHSFGEFKKYVSGAFKLSRF